jgi:murein DD-endopeptidase MepM/ murein hydrolase activator NlpD
LERRAASENFKTGNDMQIILVSRAGKVPRTLDLTNQRLRWRVLGIGAAVVLAFASLGAGVALAVASPRGRAVAEIDALHQQVNQQDRQLGDLRQDARRQLDALAIKLGQLQAQATRLNALGERLVQVGKLDSGEFNFDQPPPVGGVEVSSGNSAYSLPQTLDASIDQLASQFDTQQAQLSAMQSLLMNARIDSDLKPTGMPADGYISSYFGVRADPFDGQSALHTGLDIAVPYGSAVHTVAEGMVTYAGIRSGYGNVVEIDHGNGYMTRYAHNSRLLVHPGEHVRVGDEIAEAGSTGRSTGSHVHFEVWYDGRVVNPLAFVKNHR